MQAAKIKSLVAAGYGEDEICEALSITHTFYRRHFSETLPWTDGALEEARSMHTDFGITQLMRAYRVTRNAAQFALYTTNALKVEMPTEDELILAIHATETGAPQEVAEYLGCAYAPLVELMISAGFIERRTWVSPNEKAKIKGLLASKQFTHAEIARVTGRCRSTVTKLADSPDKRQYRTLTEKQWSSLLAEYPKSTISELARKYNVSRASIYKRLDK